ncbi:hypothetical protein [Methanobacterium sp. MBAC-LM]|uniref:hypothetical protein n=1 Tax=Methanobacterium sp. MBAC-LM TaxID=3412034 RepID=UPI003C722282
MANPEVGVSREEFLKELNQSSFLPDKEHIKLHSIILLEIFTLEDFPDLIKGLNKLYNNDSNQRILSQYSKIQDLKKGLENLNGFEWIQIELPFIYNSNLDSSFPMGIPQSLGDSIAICSFELHRISSNLIMMQIHVKLTPNLSDKINNIIYKEYTEDETTNYDTVVKSKLETSPEILKRIELSNLRYKLKNKLETSPEISKKKELSNLRYEIKKEIIRYISNYFRGYFIKLSKNNYSIVPSIDIYSLNYPEKNEDIIKWKTKLRRFFMCFGIPTIRTPFKSGRYILFEENIFKYSNYVIFANRGGQTKLTENIDGDIETRIDYYNFSLLAMYRLIKIYKDIINDLNVTISNEIQNLEENELNKVLKSRKEISKKIYYFKRFKIEFEQIKFKIFFDLEFESINGKKGETKLCEILFDEISEQINDIDNAINTLNQNANLILNLKNIEYSKNNQKWTMRLSIIVLLLALIQVIFAYFSFLR